LLELLLLLIVLSSAPEVLDAAADDWPMMTGTLCTLLRPLVAWNGDELVLLLLGLMCRFVLVLLGTLSALR
jgi:hypothetical protein